MSSSPSSLSPADQKLLALIGKLVDVQRTVQSLQADIQSAVHTAFARDADLRNEPEDLLERESEEKVVVTALKREVDALAVQVDEGLATLLKGSLANLPRLNSMRS